MSVPARRRRVYSLRPAALGCFLLWVGAAAAQAEWLQLRGDHFIVYYSPAHQRPAETSGKRAEAYYYSLAQELGYARYDNFWQWEKRVKIYLYPDRESYLQATRRPEWSQGCADYSRKSISTYVGGHDFLDTVLPHEIGHLIFRDYVGFTGDIPLWLDEGVAQWAEQAKKDERRALMRELVAQGVAVPLVRLTAANAQNLHAQVLIAVPATVSAREQSGRIVTVDNFSPVALFYLQAFSLVDFLIQSQGAAAFTGFCRQLRDGKKLDEALRFSYPLRIRSLEELEYQWRQDMRE
ncbi:MAG: hypothetical protein NC924_06030 [Candidatus Omnitrophica bacterium]|nr:hypothetical protein [Candidatus Omnitrophota bacterium]